MRTIDYRLEKGFVGLKVELDKDPLKGKAVETLTVEEKAALPEYQLKQKELVQRQQKMVGHRWMEVQMYSYNSMTDVMQPDAILAEFKQQQANASYEMYIEDDNLEKISVYLELEMIDFFYKKSLEIVNPNDFELRYIEKTEN